MSHTIKVSDETYRALEDLQEKRETFDEAVKRLIKVFRIIKQVSDTLGPGHYLRSDTPPGQEGR